MRFSARHRGFVGYVAAAALIPLLAGVACKKEPTAAPDPAPAPTPTEEKAEEEDPEAAAAAAEAAEAERKAAEARAALDAQLAKGKEAFGANCASCHGAAGEGKGKNPKLIGDGALPLDAAKTAKSRKKVKFATGADVAEYVTAQMPPKKGGSLSDEDYYAIVAFCLDGNGIAMGEVLTADNAASVAVHDVAAPQADEGGGEEADE